MKAIRTDDQIEAPPPAMRESNVHAVGAFLQPDDAVAEDAFALALDPLEIKRARSLRPTVVKRPPVLGKNAVPKPATRLPSPSTMRSSCIR